jgi:uncharacterized membrane protein YphA (DoxX/SURF4 family)
MHGFTHRTVTLARPGLILRRYLYASAHYFIAIILLAAGMFKIYDPAPLFRTLELIQFLNIQLSILFAVIIPVIEISLGVLILTGQMMRYTLIASTGLFWIFFGFSVYGYAVGFDADCGCFGNVIASSFGYEMIIRNLIFALISTSLVLLNKGKYCV